MTRDETPIGVTERRLTQALKTAPPAEVEARMRVHLDSLRARMSADPVPAAASTLTHLRGHTFGWRRAAAAVLLCAGAAAAIVASLWSPSLTLAEVREAFDKQTWVRVTYDNGREEWTNLVDGRYFFRDHNGRAVYTEPGGLRLGYFPGGSTISQDKWFAGTVRPPPGADASGRSPWGQFVEPAGRAAGGTMTRHDDTLDGKPVVRFDYHRTDALDRRVLVRQLWADPKTRLPVQVREVLRARDQAEQKRDAIVGRYEFPAAGPKDLHDLGVPRGLPVVDAEARPAPEVEALLAAARAARARFPSRVRIVTWPSGRDDGSVHVLYRDGGKLTDDQWFTSPVPGAPDFPAGEATADQILAWSATRVPVAQYLLDGSRRYSRKNPIPDLSGGVERPAVHVARYNQPLHSSNFLPESQWPYIQLMGPFQLVDPPKDAPPGIVVLRRGGVGSSRNDYWIDPARDHACVRNIWEVLADGKWKRRRVESWEAFEQLPTGQWYATRQRLEGYGVAPELTETPNQTEVEHVHVRVLEPADFPAQTFDGERLLKGADVQAE
jgi:hypothetical protein